MSKSALTCCQFSEKVNLPFIYLKHLLVPFNIETMASKIRPDMSACCIL